MIEAYFEDRNTITDWIKYPFECFISDSMGEEKNIPHHWHYYIELLYITEGDATIFLDGERCLVNEGDLVIISSREVHSICSEAGVVTKYIVIKFDPEVLYSTTRTVFEAKYIHPFIMSKYKQQKIFKSEELKDTFFCKLTHEINEEYQNKNYGFELAVRTGIGRLFLWIIRNWEQKGVKLELESISKEIDTQKLQIVVDYLDQHFSENISVFEMAKMTNMSYSYFSRFFKKVMRKTFVEYLNFIRITEAEKLLLTSDMNITEIGLSIGFTNSSYFIKQFKNFKEISPKQYKAKILKA